MSSNFRLRDATEESQLNPSHGDNQVCQICLKQSSRYTCPRCNVPYCSSTCYKDPQHAECSESFYKENFLEALKECDVSKGEQQRVMEMIQRLEPADSDDEYSEDEQSLADRLHGIDLDADAEGVWQRLNNSEKMEFADILKSDNLGMLVPVWEPWWLVHDQELIKEVQSKGLVSNAISPDSSKAACPKAIDSIPRLTDLLKSSQPSPLIIHDIINVLFSYTVLMRFYNGDTSEFSMDFTQNLLNLSTALSENRTFASLEEAIHLVKIKEHLKEAEDSRLLCLNDTAHILLGKSPSKPLEYVVGALSDCWRILSSAKKSLAKDSSDKELQKKLFGCKKKLEFYLAWANKFPESFRVASIQVNCLHSSLLEETQLEDDMRPTIERKPNKLIKEIT